MPWLPRELKTKVDDFELVLKPLSTVQDVRTARWGRRSAVCWRVVVGMQGTSPIQGCCAPFVGSRRACPHADVRPPACSADPARTGCAHEPDAGGTAIDYRRRLRHGTVISQLECSSGAPRCGGGLHAARRRMRNVVDCRSGADLAVGVDLTPEMLTVAGASNGGWRCSRAAIQFMTFDIVWCRLMLGHVREMEAAYAELSRVCCMGGVVIVSDLSAEAVAAGHKRTFRDVGGTTHELEHFAHPLERQAVAAYDVGLRLERRQDGVVDSSVMPLYVEAGQQAAYEEQLGMPLVRALLWRKNAS